MSQNVITINVIDLLLFIIQCFFPLAHLTIEDRVMHLSLLSTEI